MKFRETNDPAKCLRVGHTAECHYVSRSPAIDLPALDRARNASRNRQCSDDSAGKRKRTGVLADDEDDPNRRSALGHLG